MDQQNREIFDQQTEAFSVMRDIRDLMRQHVADSNASLQELFWKSDIAHVRYQRLVSITRESSELLVANEKGREKDTLEVTYERNELPDGSELESLEAAAGFEERRRGLSDQEMFFLKTVRAAMRRAFEE